jgi:pimeloyl-ACP methyl ester carboxylesterase
MLIRTRTAPSNKKKKRRWPKRVLICAAALLTVGCLFQYLGQALDRRNHPPEGVLVDAGGFRLQMNCSGSGSPTVIAEAGGGDFSIVWRHVQRAVAEQTRFCSYDRAGFGWSESTGAVQTRERVSADLHATLINGGIEGPYIMLGHSLGGVYVRDYALRHPESIAGIVLADSSHENQLLRMLEAMRERQDSGNQLASAVLAALSTKGEYSVIRGAGHMIQIDAPDAVIDAVLGMVARTRS